MRLLITGATGHVGCALLRQLTGTTHELRALVRNPANATLPDDVEVLRGDLTDPDDLHRALDGATEPS